MSTPCKQSEHWHNVSETAKKKLSDIHQGKGKKSELPKWRELLKQAKNVLLKVKNRP